MSITSLLFVVLSLICYFSEFTFYSVTIVEVNGVLTSDGQEWKAPIVVAGCSPYHAFNQLLPGNSSKKDVIDFQSHLSNMGELGVTMSFHGFVSIRYSYVSLVVGIVLFIFIRLITESFYFSFLFM